MKPIRYLPKSDLAVPFYIEDSKLILSQALRKGYSPDINDIISIFNILRYIDDGLEEQLNNPNKELLKSVIVGFIQMNSLNDVLNHFKELSRCLDDDFWQFFVKFKLITNLKEENFDKFLSIHQPNIHPILIQKPLRQKFCKSLRDYFLSNVKNIRYIIEEKEEKFIPKNVTSEDKILLISNYIGSENPSSSYLEILAKLNKIPPRIRLSAQKRAKKVIEQVFNSSNTFQFGVQISYKEQIEAENIEFDDGIEKFSYDINWIRLNLDKATLLNNFIYLFNYIDNQGRLTLCFQMSEQGVFERTISTNRTDWHPDSISFMQKNQVALLQLQSYSSILNNFDTSTEELINWFFKDYLKTEFEINNFQIDLPMGERPFIEKCKLLVPEIERVLKQYQLLVEDDKINHDLIALDTSGFLLTETKSFLKQKYCYLSSEDSRIATHYFYSDQCMLNYDSQANKSYETFANRLAQQKLHKSDFEDYQKTELDWLEEKGYIQFNAKNFVVANISKIILLGEIFRNGCLCYDTYKDTTKDTLDLMIADGTLLTKSSLFSEPEAKYIDYHLNQRTYINSLDLRNKYAHGSHTNSEDSDKVHASNYFQMLKIMVCIVLKINNELCKKSELPS